MPPVRPPLGELQFHLFSRPLHPELFEVQAARVVEVDGARVEVRILPEGHWISWKRAQGWASEVATVNSQPLPCGQAVYQLRLHQQRTLGTHLPCGARYEAQWTVETLEAEAFGRVHDEIVADGAKRGLLHIFPAECWQTPALAHITADARPGLVVFTCFHTFPAEQTVVKTLSLLEWREQPPSPGKRVDLKHL